MTVPQNDDVTGDCLDRLHEIDAIIVQLVRRRAEMERLLADARRAAGLPGTHLARENDIVRFYDRELPAYGANIALLLLMMR